MKPDPTSITALVMNQGLLGPCGEGVQHGLANPESSHPALLWMAAVGGGASFLRGYMFEFWGGSPEDSGERSLQPEQGRVIEVRAAPQGTSDSAMPEISLPDEVHTPHPGVRGREESRPCLWGDASWEETLPECAPTPTHENLTPGYHRIPTAPAH